MRAETKNSQNEPKNQFQAQFRSFRNTSKTVVYLMYHLGCHHWSKL